MRLFVLCAGVRLGANTARGRAHVRIAVAGSGHVLAGGRRADGSLACPRISENEQANNESNRQKQPEHLQHLDDTLGQVR